MVETPFDRDGDQRRVMRLGQVGGDVAQGPADAEIVVRLERDVGQAPSLHLFGGPAVGPVDLGRSRRAGADDVGEIGRQFAHLGVLETFEADLIDHPQIDIFNRLFGRGGERGDKAGHDKDRGKGAAPESSQNE